MNIDQILDDFARLNVLVIGDLMIDQYQIGSVSRVSPEAPVPVLEWEGEENRLGGAANVASNIAAMGAAVILCGVLGKDKESQTFFDLMESNDLDSSLILQLDKRPTTIKSRIIADDQHLLRVDKEVRSDISDQEAQLLIDRVSNYLRTHQVDIMVFQDYNKGVLTNKVIKQLIRLGKKQRIPIAVDPKFNNFWEYQDVQLFKPNLKEIRDVLPVGLVNEPEGLSDAAIYICQKLNCDLLMITLSDKGLLMHDSNSTDVYPTDIRQVADVCGAGDAVIAISALSFTVGLNKNEIAMLANLAGGQIVEKVGVVTIDRHQLANEIKQKIAEV